jgi:O-antigen/teichoic acid export membrane protein
MRQRAPSCERLRVNAMSTAEGTSRHGTMARRFARSLWTNDVLKGSAAALAIKFTGSILGFTMFALAARHMEPAGFGALAIIFNAMSFLAVVALCGQETLIVRSWDEYCGTDRPALARGALSFGIKVVIGAGSLTAVLVGLIWSAFDRDIPTSLLIAACGFLFAQALMHFSAQFSRVAAGVVIGETPREIAWRFLLVLTILGHHLTHSVFTATEFFFTAAAALLLSVVAQGWWVARTLPAAVKRSGPQDDIDAWIPRSFRMWVSAMLDTTSQYLEIIAIGFVLGPTAAAFYFVGTRITNVFAMIAGSMTAYATSQISGLYHADSRNELQNILRALAIISAILAGGAFLVILLAGKLLLWVFGAVYVSAYPELLVLAVGASVSALAGPAAYLLLLTGNEGAYPRIMACGLLARFALIAVLGPWFGLMGAVIAWSLSAIGMALALVIACRRLVQLDPSVVSALWRKPAPALPLTRSAP